MLDKRHVTLLHNIPYALPFDLRVRVLRQLVYIDKAKLVSSPATRVDLQYLFDVPVRVML